MEPGEDHEHGNPSTFRRHGAEASRQGPETRANARSLPPTASRKGRAKRDNFRPDSLDANGSNTPVANKSEGFSTFILRSKVTPDELDELLNELSAGPPGKVLPPDFSRADTYDDHD